MQPNYQQYNQAGSNGRRLRLAIIFCLVAAIALFAIIQIRVRLTTGEIVVTTNSAKNTVTIADAGSDPAGSAAKPSQKNPVQARVFSGSGSARLKPGTYFIHVKNGDIAAAQTVVLALHQTAKYTIDLPASLPVAEPVGDVNASQFKVDPLGISFIDNRKKSLNRIDSNNSVSLINRLGFSSMQWADANFGVAQDVAGTLYSLNNSSVKLLAGLPASSGSGAPSYAVAPNHTIYVGLNKDIYESAGSGFKKIYTASTSSFSLYASNDKLLVVLAPAGSNENGSARAVTISNDGSAVEKTMPAGVFAYYWSPEANRLLSVNEGPSRIYNGLLTPVAVVPNSLPTASTWLDNQTILYAQNGQLWQFNVVTGAAKALAGLGNNQTIVSMQVGPNKAYVYLSVQNTANSGTYFSLYRFGLNGQPVSDAVIKLHQQLPWLTEGCFLSLINFTSPTVEAVQSHNYDNCLAVARDFVQKAGVDPNKFVYQLSKIPPTTPTSQGQ